MIWSNDWIDSGESYPQVLPLSGNGLPPNDSLMTSTPATFTA